MGRLYTVVMRIMSVPQTIDWIARSKNFSSSIHGNLQRFEIWIDLSNKGRKFVVLMILREAQNRKNNKEYFSYFELLFKRLIIR